MIRVPDRKEMHREYLRKQRIGLTLLGVAVITGFPALLVGLISLVALMMGVVMVFTPDQDVSMVKVHDFRVFTPDHDKLDLSLLKAVVSLLGDGADANCRDEPPHNLTL